MQRKYRRSLSAGSTLPHSTPQRSSLFPYENWQQINPTRNPSPTRYHPYVHHPITPSASLDRAEVPHLPQSLPPFHIPSYSSPSRSPNTAQTPRAAYSAENSPSAAYRAVKQLPDIHTLLASPSTSPNNLLLPPLQHRRLSDPGYSSAPISDLESSLTDVNDSCKEVKSRMQLASLLS